VSGTRTPEPGSMHEWLSTPATGKLLPTAQAPVRPWKTRLLPVLVDVWIVVVWFAVVGVVGALVWWKVTPLAAYTRTTDNGSMDEQQLAMQIATDGWYFVVAGVGGLLSGLVLVLWRRRGPMLMVFLVGAAGFLATVLMLKVGLSLGPADPKDVLPHLTVGQKAHLRLDPLGAQGKPLRGGLWYVWSVAALAGAMLGFWAGEFQASRRRHAVAMAEYRRVDPVPVEQPGAAAPNG
jgi:hypothetical protein